MKRPDDVKREFVRQWLRKAYCDLEAAQCLLRGGPDLFHGVAFHAQQAVEKLLKAVLVWHQVEFAKIHDISRILELVRTADPQLAEAARESTALTPYGVEVRYPGDEPEPTREEASEAVTIAMRVQKAVLQRLPHEFESHPRRE